MAEIIDAYAHVGFPHFGKTEELLSVWKQWGIRGGSIALPPGIPDLPALESARDALGDRVRLFGIPFGADTAQRRRNAEDQVAFGIAGMRLMPNEMLDNPGVLEVLGEAGACLMAINVYGSSDLTRTMIDWLEKYAGGTIAAPHFLRPGTIDDGVPDPGAFRDLLRHPRMHAIFSRHGGASSRPYPHEDLKPWVEDVAAVLTWDRILWGSEFPVLFHRDEQMDEAMRWIEALEIALDDNQRAAYFGGNAQRLWFDQSAPKGGPLDPVPEWVTQGLNAFRERARPVPTVRTRELRIPLELHGRLLSDYLDKQRADPNLRFQEYLVSRIEAGAAKASP